MFKPNSRARAHAALASFALLAAAAATAAPAAESALSTARARAEAAVASLPGARATWRPAQPGPALITGVSLAAPGDDLESRARDFVAAHPALIGVPADQLEVVRVETTGRGQRVTLSQRAGRLPLDGHELILGFDKAGAVRSITSSLRLVEGLHEARFDASDAATIARRAANGLVVAPGGTPIAVVGKDGKARPALRLLASQPEALRAFRVTVDLHEGAVVGVREVTRR